MCGVCQDEKIGVMYQYWYGRGCVNHSLKRRGCVNLDKNVCLLWWKGWGEDCDSKKKTEMEVRGFSEKETAQGGF